MTRVVIRVQHQALGPAVQGEVGIDGVLAGRGGGGRGVNEGGAHHKGQQQRKEEDHCFNLKY